MKSVFWKILSCIVALILLGGIYWKISTRRGVRYIIPYNYVGWIRVQYNAPDAPHLPIVDGYLVAVIPSNGFLKTATPLEKRWGADQYFQLNKNGNKKRLVAYGFDSDKTMIWAGSTNGSRLKFFCGTKRQFDRNEEY